ncbi:MAG: hypothetical protein QOE57_3127 [Acidimicrobiaceae bacterium]|nr:hypothetical protein [Acidimicrobiaceae bacterium]
METDRHGVDRALEHDRDLGVGQPFPGGELQDFRVCLPEPAERGPDLFRGLVIVSGRLDLGGLPGWGGLVESGQEPVSAGVTARCVGQNLPGDCEQPRQLVVVRNVTDPPPGGEEDVSDDVVGGRPVRAAAQRVGEDAPPMAFEQQSVALLNLIGRGHAWCSS